MIMSFASKFLLLNTIGERWSWGTTIFMTIEKSGATADFELLCPETIDLKWFFSSRGPQRRVFVAGVEVKATRDDANKVTQIRNPL
jgi:hypothetical protein